MPVILKLWRLASGEAHGEVFCDVTVLPQCHWVRTLKPGLNIHSSHSTYLGAILACSKLFLLFSAIS